MTNFRNEHGELPGDICCLRSGGMCYDHAKMLKDAGVAQVAEHGTRNAEVASSTDAASPSFEQISRCCK